MGHNFGPQAHSCAHFSSESSSVPLKEAPQLLQYVASVKKSWKNLGVLKVEIEGDESNETIRC